MSKDTLQTDDGRRSNRKANLRRITALIMIMVATALLGVDFVRLPQKVYSVGQVADVDIRASSSFQFVDWESTMQRQREAEIAVPRVFDFDASLSSRVQTRIERAFELGRQREAEVMLKARAEGREQATTAELSEIGQEFLRMLELSLAVEDVQQVIAARWNRNMERQVKEFLSVGMQGYVLADRTALPSDSSAVTVIRIYPDRQDEIRIDDFSQIMTPQEARRAISLYALESTSSDEQHSRSALAVARAAVRSNFSYNQLLTESRRRSAQEDVAQVVIHVQRGTAIARQGDVLTQQQVDMINVLTDTRSGAGMVGVLFALMAFAGLLFLTMYQFGSGFIRKFSTQPRDLEAMAILLVLVLVFARVTIELSTVLASQVGMGTSPTTFWYLVPFAGGAMLIRILVNSESTLMWILVGAGLTGLLMDQNVLFALFFAISGFTAAGGIAHTKERVNVLRAGVQTGLVNAGAALLIGLVRVHLGDQPLVEAATLPLWDVGCGFMGGIFSAILVLGLVPMFEQFGFVTDYKLLELANLNHPLLRQLMLRTPGTYHHSVTVASLCEAAAEAVGANALQVKVSCYFHDIGKAVQPKYFIENQGGGPNPHDRLPPKTSAKIIINHVLDGEAIAKQYKLPQPIIDGIVMHHGTGLIRFFYAKALEQAEPGQEVDEADYRYPGQCPTTREAGIIMLADRVEAACRTLKDPSRDNIRKLIQELVNGAVVDGQLMDCPLTVRELYTIVDAFTNTLLGIYHHRIEYPGLPQLPPNVTNKASQTGPIITLEIPNPLNEEEPTNKPMDDRAHKQEKNEVQTQSDAVDPVPTEPLPPTGPRLVGPDEANSSEKIEGG